MSDFSGIAIETYSTKFAEHEKERATSAFNGKYKLMVERFKDINDYYDKVDRQDVIDHLKRLIQEDVSVKDWCPVKMEGFHSLHLEKAMSIRYANHGTMGDSYGRAMAGSSSRIAQIEKMKEGIQKW